MSIDYQRLGAIIAEHLRPPISDPAKTGQVTITVTATRPVADAESGIRIVIDFGRVPGDINNAVQSEARHQGIEDTRISLNVRVGAGDEGNTVGNKQGGISIVGPNLDPERIAKAVRDCQNSLNSLYISIGECDFDSGAAAAVDEHSHDSSPSVGGCGDPQPTEGEAGGDRS